MPEYAGFFRKIPVNDSGMDFTHKFRHFPNPATKSRKVAATKSRKVAATRSCNVAATKSRKAAATKSSKTNLHTKN